jgi:hypothetical protein
MRSGPASCGTSAISPAFPNLYAKPPFGGPEQLLAYLGRYTHRAAIANSRLLSLSDGKVRFTWKDYRQGGKTRVMTLDADEFIRRFLLHALPDGFHRIRHYGFLANGSRGDNLARCHWLLDARDTGACEPAHNHPKGERPLTATDFAICPDCVAPCGGSQPCRAPATLSHSPVTHHDCPADLYNHHARPPRSYGRKLVTA